MGKWRLKAVNLPKVTQLINSKFIFVSPQIGWPIIVYWRIQIFLFHKNCHLYQTYIFIWFGVYFWTPNSVMLMCLLITMRLPSYFNHWHFNLLLVKVISFSLISSFWDFMISQCVYASLINYPQIILISGQWLWHSWAIGVREWLLTFTAV